IRTLLDGWAYKRPYPTSTQRRAALAAFLTRYNTQRPHRSLNGQTPLQRLADRNKTPAAYS
ncbi:MAG: integrase core domain-containing protein, partial [Actinomycetota bacterium]|nr:integrase core domain-containing protein [Actinomycetota bacterium]